MCYRNLSHYIKNNNNEKSESLLLEFFFHVIHVWGWLAGSQLVLQKQDSRAHAPIHVKTLRTLAQLTVYWSEWGSIFEHNVELS